MGCLYCSSRAAARIASLSRLAKRYQRSSTPCFTLVRTGQGTRCDWSRPTQSFQHGSPFCPDHQRLKNCTAFLTNARLVTVASLPLPRPLDVTEGAQVVFPHALKAALIPAPLRILSCSLYALAAIAHPKHIRLEVKQ
jgi:hypothetical protein